MGKVLGEGRKEVEEEKEDSVHTNDAIGDVDAVVLQTTTMHLAMTMMMGGRHTEWTTCRTYETTSRDNYP